MAKRKVPVNDNGRYERERPRPKPRPRECSITTVLGVLIVAVLGMIGLVGYMYLKDTNWVMNRNIQLDNKSKNHAGISLNKNSLGSLFGRKTNDAGTAEKDGKSDQTADFIRKVMDESGVRKIPAVVKTTNPAVKTAVTAKKPVEKKPVPTVKKTSTAAKTSPTVKNPVTPKKTASTPAVQQPGPRDIQVYFIRYNSSDDSVTLSAVKRRLPATEKPLEDTLRTLLLGTTDEEDAKQFSSAIPGGVVIRSIRVVDGVATISLSGNFESGTGKKMMQARIYQLVYTATEFSTVRKVQVLLDGRKSADFGGEGIDLSRPIGRLSASAPRF